MNIVTAIIGFISLIIGAFVGLALMVAGLTLLNAFVLIKLWGWFIVPFFGLPPLIIPVAIGLALIVSFLAVPINTAKSEDDPSKVRGHIISGFLRPFVVLLFGWIASTFIPSDIKPFYQAPTATVVVQGVEK